MTLLRFLAGWAMMTCIGVVVAIPWLEPAATPFGMMAYVGFSPMPTLVPGMGSNALPKELRRRQQDIPLNWCGFIGGNNGKVLSCDASTRCVYLGAAVGCCGDISGGSVNLATCADLYSSCVDTASRCDAACSSDSKILKCPGLQQHSYCGTFTFSTDFTKFQCVSGTSIYTSVQLIPDFYATVALGALLTSGTGGLSMTDSPSTRRISATPATRSRTTGSDTATAVTRGTGTATNMTNPTSHSGISIVIVIAIVGGIAVLLLAIAVAFCVWCCRRRKGRANKPPKPGKLNQTSQPLMQPSPPAGQAYDGPSELHNISSPNAFAPTPYNTNSQVPPPQYSPSVAGYYTEPKESAIEIDSISQNLPATSASNQPILVDPYQRTNTVSPVSSTSPAYGGWPNQAHPPPPPSFRQPQSEQHRPEIYEMSSGGR